MNNRKLTVREHIDHIRSLATKMFALNTGLAYIRFDICSDATLGLVQFRGSRDQILPGNDLAMCNPFLDMLMFFDEFLVHEYGVKATVKMYMFGPSLMTEITGAR